MKKKLKLIFIVFGFILFVTSSCNEDFLELNPQSKLSANHFFKTKTQIRQAVNGAYVPMRELGKGVYWIYGEMRSDNTSFQYNNSNRGLESQREFVDEFLVAPTSGSLLEFWQTSYNGISRCNGVLDNISNIEISAELNDQFVGEVKFLRAFYYFNLVRQFGAIPLRLKFVTSPELSKSETKAGIEDIYKSIVADLEDAASKLPKKNEYASSEVGRATEEAAKTLLAKVHLSLKEYDKAITLLRDLQTSGFRLLPNYSDIFDPNNKNNDESIFEIQYLGEIPELSSDFTYTFAPYDSGSFVTRDPGTSLDVSSGWNIPTKDMIAAYESGDSRKSASIALGYNGVDNTFISQPHVIKYNWGTSGPGRTNVNFPVLRYSDVLLMLAECLNEKGFVADGEAFQLLNQIRNRAQLPNKSTSNSDPKLILTNQSDFRDAIFKERRIEFAFENQRWYDLLRSGKAIATMNKHGQEEIKLKPYIPAGAYHVDENKLLLPIPQIETDQDK